MAGIEIVRDDQARNGYFWVEQIQTRNGTAREKPLRLDQLDGLTGEWHLLGRALSPLFIGSGEVEIDSAGQMFFRFARLHERLLIPSTSLKGVVRSNVELLSPSCAGGTPSCECPACGIFGRLGVPGRITFGDALLEPAEIRVEVFAQRTEARFDGPPDTGNRPFRKLYSRETAPGQLVPFEDRERLETVLSGAEWSVIVRFHHLQDWQLGLLVIAMGMAPGMEFDFKAGGGKNRSLGAMRLGWASGQTARGTDWFLARRPPAQPQPPTEWLKAYRQKAQGWGVWENVQSIVEALREEYGHVESD